MIIQIQGLIATHRPFAEGEALSNPDSHRQVELGPHNLVADGGIHALALPETVLRPGSKIQRTSEVQVGRLVCRVDQSAEGGAHGAKLSHQIGAPAMVFQNRVLEVEAQGEIQKVNAGIRLCKTGVVGVVILRIRITPPEIRTNDYCQGKMGIELHTMEFMDPHTPQIAERGQVVATRALEKIAVSVPQAVASCHLDGVVVQNLVRRAFLGVLGEQRHASKH